MAAHYRRNHYVPQWYQYRFLPDDLPEQKFRYLDLKPDAIIDSKGHKHFRNALRRLGPPNCFYADDLYTTRFGNWASTEIEQNFFGVIDNLGHDAVEYFASFKHPDVNPPAFHALITYMSLQKLRTPKGLSYLSKSVRLNEKNFVLLQMQRLERLFCALWTECIWSIADAAESETKFIISDHPVTVYNEGCFPLSKWCRDDNDPPIWFTGTHTLFPLSLDKILILTNLSWVRNPYGNPLQARPNPELLRSAIFNFTQIQIGRKLSDTEVNEINFIIKRRAYRYIAAANKEWLYPEKKISSQHWNKLGRGYLLMPDPRSVSFSRQTIIGYESQRADIYDEYGRRPWQLNYKDEAQSEKEWRTSQAFKGEFARVFGPKRRGRGYEVRNQDDHEDSPDYHAYHLSLESKYKPKYGKKRR